jgi:hypothetical protein
MTQQGRGGVALGPTVLSSFVGAPWGVTLMIFLSPLLARAALQFGPADICSLMLLGLLAGSTLARGSPLKGVAMTVLGLFLGSIGTDIETGTDRFTFGLTQLGDGVELIALALGLFGIAQFMASVNRLAQTSPMVFVPSGARLISLASMASGAMSATATLARSPASALAIARPGPPPPPSTSAVLPVRPKSIVEPLYTDISFGDGTIRNGTLDLKFERRRITGRRAQGKPLLHEFFIRTMDCV